MKLMELSRILEYKSGGIFNTKTCPSVFLGYEQKISAPKNFLVVCDEGTKHIALNFNANPFILRNLAELEKALENYEGIFAVGSGTVCDNSKLASFKAKKPFMVFGTALSMNGYLSSNASIYGTSGMKESFKCHLPQALYFDLKILEDCPITLKKAGFGDMVARISAQNDCLLSHTKKGTTYKEELFSFRIPSETFLLENHKKLLENDDEFTLEMLENTLFSGLSMHIFGSSFTASGGEHAMAHVAEHKFEKVKAFYHGLQISAFTIEMLKIQQKFKEEKLVKFEFNLEQILQALQMPTSFKDLNLTEEEFVEIKKDAKTLRERYGFLNLE
jgi:glycerol dehydrogenase-like iron-containing ADH family enzyme